MDSQRVCVTNGGMTHAFSNQTTLFLIKWKNGPEVNFIAYTHVYHMYIYIYIYLSGPF